MEKKYKYDIALSFAGEQRAYVEELALYLKKNNISVFYDYFEQVNLWGKDLTEKLEQIDATEARYCVIFISEEYAKKGWTCHERAAAAQRMLECRTKSIDYILPVKFDETKIPAIFNTVGCINAKDYSPLQVGEMLIQKITGENKPLNISFRILSEKICCELKNAMQFVNIHISIEEKGTDYNYNFQKDKKTIYMVQFKLIAETETEIYFKIYEKFDSSSFYTDIPDATININKVNNNIDIQNFGFFCSEMNKKNIQELISNLKFNILKAVGVY